MQVLKKPDRRISRAIIAWLAAMFVTLLVVLLGVLPPFVDEPFRGVLMAGFKPFCHQLPDRSFHIHGVQLALCHRCLGIYAGIPLAVAGFIAIRKWDGYLSKQAKYIIFASLVPLGLDWILDFAGILANSPLSRLITGCLFGLTAGYYLARGIVSIGADADSAKAAKQSVTEDTVLQGDT